MSMIRFVEAVKAAVADGNGQEVVLEFVDADLVAMTGPQGAYQPMTGTLSKSVGTIAKITKMVCRRKNSPDLNPILIFKSTNGLTLDQFNEMFAHNTRLIPDLPKYPVLGGYEVVLTLDAAGGTGDISWMTKGENEHFINVGNIPSSAGVASPGNFAFAPTGFEGQGDVRSRFGAPTEVRHGVGVNRPPGLIGSGPGS